MKQTKQTDPLKAARLRIVNDRPLENIKRVAEKLGLILHNQPKRKAGGKSGRK